jgi:hypothetical protein
MNDAVYKFKRYEDASLEYTGINTHTNTVIGGWDTVIEKVAIEEKEIEEKDMEEEEEVEEYTPTENPWEHLQVGETVVHKSFGQGEIVSIDDKYIIVHFSAYEKKFLFPEAFIRGYLSC